MENEQVEISSTPNVDSLVKQLTELGITPKKTLLEMKKQLKAAIKKQQQRPLPVKDLRDFMEKELVYNQIRRPEFMFSIIDLRKKYREFYTKSRSGSLNDMLSDLGMQFEGREHSGIDDARNIAKIFIKMAKDGCQMDMTTNLRKHKATKGEWSNKRK
ncbi:ERI1 exoribonuclease 2 [Boothiomyces sp. JEL0838]|nr:ERI1 exoribonuclease 2 [Boothiomyces sp. JEL0838]KAJ3313495.1 ERI1 exoribonuclease 2 [Boothiomyces sp. JEL0838]